MRWQSRTAMDWIRPEPARRRAVLAGAALVALAAGPAAATSGALRLDEAVARALRDAPEAKIARLEAGQADDQAAAARSIYYPRASVSSQAGWSNRQDDTVNAIDGQGVLKRYPLSSLGSSEPWLSLVLEQMVFDLREWRSAERQQLEAEVAAVSEAQQRETVSYATTMSYLDVVRLEAYTALDRQRVSDAEWLNRQAALLHDAGRALPGERDQAALAVDEARLAADDDAAALRDARLALARTIGAPPEDAAELSVDAGSLPPVDPGALDPQREDSMSAAPTLRTLELRKRMEELGVSAARAGYLPTLALRGGYFHYGTKRFDSFESELAVGVDLKIPVFDGFRTSNTVDGASKAAEAAKLRYDVLREETRARVSALLRELRTAQQQPALAEKRARMAAERQRLADLSLQGQRGTVAQALAARSDAIREGRAAVDARLAPVRVWAALQRETGRLADLLAPGARADATGLEP
ncbi:MAG: TolC family protein [Deltaproteobacteria bacterium]|nr:TolC family protein [Deltaproteobacteria bacterium]